MDSVKVYGENKVLTPDRVIEGCAFERANASGEVYNLVSGSQTIPFYAVNGRKVRVSGGYSLYSGDRYGMGGGYNVADVKIGDGNYWSVVGNSMPFEGTYTTLAVSENAVVELIE